MTTFASPPLFRSVLRGLRIVTFVALLIPMLAPVLSFPAGALADEAPPTENGDAQVDTDVTAPLVTVPGTVTVQADPGTDEAVVDFDVSAADDVDGPVDVTCDWASGSSFPVGTTAVTCVAADAAGNEGSGIFDVIVEPAPDTTAPIIDNVPAEIEVDAEDDSGATVTYDLPTASDDVDGAIAVDCAPPPGSWFAVGSTTVICSAGDSSGNRAEASFIVTVDPLPTAVPTDIPVPTPTETPTSEPTQTPTEEPTAIPTEAPTDTPTSTSTEEPTSTPTPTPTAPASITSDKDDYAPGETVTLSGGNWQPGESVHIFVNDDEGQTWRRDVDVAAGEDGTIADSFNLPDWFVATYTVKATGTQSGIATTTFTDSISFGSTATNNTSGSAGSITISRPGTVVAGDVMLAQITYAGTTGLSTLGQPSGWSLINRRDNTAAIGQAIFWKVAGSSEPASYTWTFSPNRRAVGSIAVYSGAASPNPIDASASAVGSGTSLTAPNVTTATRSTMVVTFYGLAANATLSTPSSMTQRYHTASATSGLTIMGSDVEQFDTGATGANTSTSTQSALWVAHTVAINWVQTATGGSGGTPVMNLSEAKPIDATEDDVLLANIMIRNGTANITAPSGWNLVAKRTNTNTQLVTQATYWKVVGASEPASYTWTFSTAVIAVGGIVAYADIDTQNPIDAFATNPATDSSLGSSSSLAAPSVTTTTANAIIVALYAASGNGSIAPPSGMLVRYNVGSGNSRLAVYDAVQTTAGPSGIKTASDPGTVQYVAQTIALRRKSVGPTKLAFTTAAQSGAVNDCLGPITVQTQNPSDAPTNVASTTTVSLASDGTGAFFSDGSCATSAGTSVAISAGSDSATFYYKPTARGTGSHTLSASASGLTSATQAQTVVKASQTIDFAALADATYGDAPFTVSATGGGSGNPVSFSVGATDDCTSSGTNGATIMITGAGPCTVTASQGGNDDYDAAPSVSRTFSIARKQLTGSFTADNKTYDGTAAATIASRSVAGKVGTDDVSLAGGTATFADEHAGTAKTVTATGFTLTGADAANYSLAPGPWTATADITAREITVTADATSKVYGAADPALTYTVTNGSLVTGESFDGALTRDPGESVAGSPYAIRQGTLTAGGNYDLTFVGADFTIAKAVLQVDASDKSMTYGDVAPALTYTLSGFENGEDAAAAGVSGTANCSLDPGAGPNVGTYGDAITCDPGTLSAANYDFATGSKASLTIAARPVTVKADDKTKVVGATDPALTYTVTSGSVVIGDSFGGALTRDPGESVGSYAIRQGSLSLGSNYAVTFVDGTLTIVYGFGGFLQPINYTAHQTGGSPNTSLFKAGSTVPVKFELKDAAGNVLPCAGTATWMGVVKGGPITAGVDELTFTDPATPGDTYTCSNGRYQFNWSTKGLAAGYYYRIGVKLADGQTYFVYIGLK